MHFQGEVFWMGPGVCAQVRFEGFGGTRKTFRMCVGAPGGEGNGPDHPRVLQKYRFCLALHFTDTNQVLGMGGLRCSGSDQAPLGMGGDRCNKWTWGTHDRSGLPWEASAGGRGCSDKMAAGITRKHTVWGALWCPRVLSVNNVESFSLHYYKNGF